jgi:hypothetical protein
MMMEAIGFSETLVLTRGTGRNTKKGAALYTIIAVKTSYLTIILAYDKDFISNTFKFTNFIYF